MKQLHIDLKNCYGIGEMNSEIKFGKGKNACVIYVPNGTMKTSFTNTVLDMIDGKQPQDKIFKDRVTSASITLDGASISKDNCYVFNNQKDNGNECLSTLLANKQLKARYDEILQRLTDSWSGLRKKLSTDSRSSDCEDELIKTFSNAADTSIFECLMSKLCQGIYKTDIIKNKFISNVHKKRSFIGLIPFVRNLIEYTDGDSSGDYKLLTSCLHQKTDTDAIKINEICDVYKSHLSGISETEIAFKAEKYKDVLFEEATAVLDDSNDVDLANKLILSMAIRLKSEALMKTFLSEEQQAEMKPNLNISYNSKDVRES